MASYDLLADEYYDPVHSTCRNFDQATVAAFAARPPESFSHGLVLEVGCGRGRVGEFLGIDPCRVVQLDSSLRMLQLAPREASVLRLHADATRVPLLDRQFSMVIAFLADAFIGLSFFSEAFRLLETGGGLLLTTPSYEWGRALRGDVDPEHSEARFVNKKNHVVRVPSVLIPIDRLIAMLEYCGFREVTAAKHSLPQGAHPVSPDVTRVAVSLRRSVFELPLLYVVSAQRP